MALLTLLASLLVQQCDPHYPQSLSGEKICIPVFPPDIDCPDIDAQSKPITVVDIGDGEPDPHRLDRDNDGIGCESKKSSAN